LELQEKTQTDSYVFIRIIRHLGLELILAAEFAMNRQQFLLIFFLLALLGLQMEAFHFPLLRRSVGFVKMMVSPIISETPAPSVSKSRIQLTITGTSVNNALFRGEVKKELTFLRGCNAVFSTSASDIEEANIVAEGKTEKIANFLKWLDSMSIDIALRKPNFIGPR
jgi:hypothetical protein